MRVAYIHQYFKTPLEGGAIRSYYIARAMAEAGIEVEMITTHNSREYLQKKIEGISVHYIPVFYDNSFGFYRRLFSFIRFIFLASKYTSRLKPDRCYATSTPLTIGCVALWLKYRHKIPFFFEVRDLWPEAPVALGFLNNPLLVKAAEWLEKKIYHKAEKIVCLSPAIENSIKKRFLYLQTLRIPNMSDTSFFHPEEKKKLLMKKFNVGKNDFVISYFGALGKINHLDYLLKSAKVCQDKNYPVRFFIAGKGAMEDHLVRLSKKHNLLNLAFVGHLNKYELRDLLNITDAAYISFLNNPALETNSPNKFFDALAAGKMIITNVKGWIKELVDENDCGFYVDPQNPDEFCRKLENYLDDPLLLQFVKDNSRMLAETQFSREKLTGKILDEFLTGRSKRSTQSMGL